MVIIWFSLRIIEMKADRLVVKVQMEAGSVRTEQITFRAHVNWKRLDFPIVRRHPLDSKCGTCASKNTSL